MTRRTQTCAVLLGCAFTAVSLSGCSSPYGDIERIDEGTVLERSVADPSHRYRIHLAAGQFLELVVEQRGIDLAASLFAPTGELLIAMDSPNADLGPEPVLLLAQKTGDHILEIRNGDPESAGDYTLRVLRCRDATKRDRTRAAAAEHHWRGDQMRKQAIDAGDEAHRSALTEYQKAIGLWQSASDALLEALTLRRMEEVYNRLGDEKAELASLERAVSHYRNLGAIREEARLQCKLGTLHGNSGRYQQALKDYHRARELFDHLGDQHRAASMLNNIALVYDAMGRWQEALGFFDQALARCRELKTPKDEAVTLNNIAEVYISLAQLRAARDTLEQEKVLKLRRLAGDRRGEAKTLNTRGTVFRRLDQLEQARTDFEQALAIHRELDDEEGMIVTLIGLLVACLEKLDPRRDVVNMMLANAYILLGEAYAALGFPERMAEYSEKARSFAERGEYPEAVAVAELIRQWNLGTTGREARLGAAATALVNALSDSDVGFLQMNAGNFRPILALLFAGAAQDERAESLARRWLADPDKQGVSWYRAAALAMLGNLHFKRCRNDEALRYWQEARESFRQLGQKDLEAVILAAIAALHWKSGRPGEAVRWCLEAIDHFEAVVSDVHVDDLLTSFLGGDRHRLYQLAIELLAATGRPDEAFAYAEKARARAFLHLLGNQRLDPTRGAEPELVARAEALRARMRVWEGRLASASGEVRGRLEEDLRRAHKEHEELVVKIKLTNPEYASLVSVAPVDLGTLQRQVLDADVTLIAYYVAAGRVLAWVVDRESFASASIPMTDAELAEVRCMAGELAYHRCKTEPSRASFPSCQRGLRLLVGCAQDPDRAAVLYRKLIAPLVPHIRHRKLALVPHGVLHYLPFAALRDPQTGRYLIADYALSYAPSASVLSFLRRKASPIDGEVLVLGNPETALEPLKGARQEAQTVAKLFATTPVLEAEATETRVRERAGEIDLLHLAAHGFYKPETPRFSHVALAADQVHDGNLEVHEVFGSLDLRGVNLVVLSGCQTALGERTQGDEIIGLTRAFLYAGSPNVMSTLWNIDDEASAELMATFYNHLLGGATAAQALRRAQLEMLVRPGYEAPYYWAAFTVTGDPNGRWGMAD